MALNKPGVEPDRGQQPGSAPEVPPGFRRPATDQERLAAFRRQMHACFTARADELFELCDAVLCADGPVTSLPGLSLAPEHRRGHGALYDGLNSGEIDIGRFRRCVAGVPVPPWPDGQIRLAVDVSNWTRPDAVTSPDREFCHQYGRGRGQAQMIPGWRYSFVAALEPGRTSWVLPLDAVRLAPGSDPDTEVTAAQLREVVQRLQDAGHWKPGDPPIRITLDAGYDTPRLAFLLAGLPVLLTGRLRSDRVMYHPPASPAGRAGRPAVHGPARRLADPASPPGPAVTTTTDTTRYGTAPSARGTAPTPNSAAGPPGPATTARCRSSRARSSS
jgi:hypothetical protein